MDPINVREDSEGLGFRINSDCRQICLRKCQSALHRTFCSSNFLYPLNEMTFQWLSLPGCRPWHRPKQIGNRHAEHNNNLLAAISEVGGLHRFYVQRANSAARKGALTLTVQTCRNDKLNLFVTAQCPLSTTARYSLVRSEFMPFFHPTISQQSLRRIVAVRWILDAKLQLNEMRTEECES